ncbi:hypothetical protein [Candidatus Uabimicrobium amorphum]|uniref:Uncharacterized protein n=1 Tax=Uabimicrobium amorphum TaxID=2596890 RepID=A0A5S9IPY6_UABAM|nr:hypothetical protein [Candidatus Uabimicrobium amorphum]BBM85754.1 hypothetical protein UABAM_04132 [Candidatus Uabimicrobium amorphum]
MKRLPYFVSIFILVSCVSSPQREMIDFNKQQPAPRHHAQHQAQQKHQDHQHQNQDHSASKSDELPGEDLPAFLREESDEQSTIDLSDAKNDDYEEAQNFFESIEDPKETPPADTAMPRSIEERLAYTATLVKEKENDQAREAIHIVMSDDQFPQLPLDKKLLAYSLNGQLQMRDFNHDAALASFNKALKLFNEQGEVSSENIRVVRLIVYYRSRVHNKLANYPDSAADMKAYIALSEQANQTVTSQEYARLAIAYYLAEDYESCKAILPKVSEADRKELAEQLEDEMFLLQESEY